MPRPVLIGPFVFAILLPLISIVMLWRRPRRPLAGWLATLVFAAGIVGFGVLVAPWSSFGTAARAAVALLFVLAIVFSLLRKPAAEEASESPVRAMVKVIVGVFFGAVAISALRAREVPPGAIDLAFPLRGGSYRISHGGSTPATNMYNADRAQRYAVDVSSPKGAVVSPCNGIVRNAANATVVLRCADVDVTLANLLPSIKPGMRIAARTPIGKTGTADLHVYATRSDIAVPARFDGRWLVRNDMMHSR